MEISKKPGARKQYGSRQAVRLLLPTELVEHIDLVATNRTQWLVEAAQEKRMMEMRKQDTLRKGKKTMQWSSDAQAYFGTTSDGREIRVEGVEYAESQQAGADDEVLSDPDMWASLAGDNQNVTIV